MDDDKRDLAILDVAVRAERVHWTNFKSETLLWPRTLSGHLSGLVRSGLLHENSDGTYSANRAGMMLWARSLLDQWGYPGGRRGRESWYWLETGRGLYNDQLRAIRWLRDLPPVRWLSEEAHIEEAGVDAPRDLPSARWLSDLVGVVRDGPPRQVHVPAGGFIRLLMERIDEAARAFSRDS